jgi:hypothetical protein
MTMYALIENGEITRINVTLPTSVNGASVGKNATNLEAVGLYPIVGDEPTHTDRERIAGPQYVFDGTQVNRVFTVEAIPDEEKAGQVRAERDSLLAKTDWRFRSDMTPSQEWKDYCQALRDVPSQAGFPWEVTWPIQPE